MRLTSTDKLLDFIQNLPDRVTLSELFLCLCGRFDKDVSRDLGRVAQGNSTPESWNAFSTKNRDECEEEIRASIQLRSLIESDIQNTANDLEAQRIACEVLSLNIYDSIHR